jgi:4-amino-4-deoxy-L-arabinose transferase-like glycosyltransferase
MTTARTLARLHVPLLLAASVALASWAAVGDSATIDEVGHLTAGLAVLRSADFRLSPDHPPLARVWAALPVHLARYAWPPADAPGWSDGNWFQFSRALFGLNDPARLLTPARAMVVVLLAATCLATWGMARALFGPGAAAVALLLAAFDPGLLAHGHYVTTDLPMTLAAALALWTVARLLDEVSATRMAAAAAALTALALVKLTAVLVVPSLVVMAALAALRSAPLRLRVPGRAVRAVEPRGRRLLVVSAVALLLSLAVWAGMWAGYGFRYDIACGPDAAQAVAYPRAMLGPPYPSDMAGAWDLALRDPATGQPRGGLVSAALQVARDRRLLPEAYLFGWAMLRRHAQARVGYLGGELYTGGRASYFPLAFLWKTPLATLVLFALGLAALAWRRARVRAPLLGAGLLAFAAVYVAATLHVDLNVGHRHLLPLYPAVFAVGGASWTWARTRPLRVAVLALAAATALSTLASAPGFLGYFNEAAGGWRGGHRLLADSNVDWSQDLVRLRTWMDRRPGEPVALLQSGHAPWPRGLTALPLIAREPGEATAAFAPGVYAVSANELVGLFKPYQRAEAWRDPRLLAQYRALWAGARFDTPAAGQTFDALRRALLVSRLRQRPADQRVGTSLFLYRLSQADLDALTQP